LIFGFGWASVLPVWYQKRRFGLDLFKIIPVIISLVPYDE